MALEVDSEPYQGIFNVRHLSNARGREIDVNAKLATLERREGHSVENAIDKLLQLKDPRRYGSGECRNRLARLMLDAEAAPDDTDVYAKLLNEIAAAIASKNCDCVKQALRSCRHAGQYQIIQHAVFLVGSWSTTVDAGGDAVCDCTFGMAVSAQNQRGQQCSPAPLVGFHTARRIANALKVSPLGINSTFDVLNVLIETDAAARVDWHVWSNFAREYGMKRQRALVPTLEHSPFKPLIEFNPQVRLILGTAHSEVPLWDKFSQDNAQLDAALKSISDASADRLVGNFVHITCPRPILDAINAVQQTWNVCNWCAFNGRVSRKQRDYWPKLQTVPMFDGRGMVILSAHGEQFGWILDQGEPWRDELEGLAFALQSIGK